MTVILDHELSALPDKHSFRLEEFENDLKAVWYDYHDDAQVINLLGHPAMLRRLASLMAATIGSQVDRIVAFGLGAGAIGTAVALEVGIPFAVVDFDGEATTKVVAGVTHPEENVVLLSFWADGEEQVFEWAERAGLRVSRWTVFAEDLRQNQPFSGNRLSIIRISEDGLNAQETRVI